MLSLPIGHHSEPQPAVCSSYTEAAPEGTQVVVKNTFINLEGVQDSAPQRRVSDFGGITPTRAAAGPFLPDDAVAVAVAAQHATQECCLHQMQLCGDGQVWFAVGARPYVEQPYMGTFVGMADCASPDSSPIHNPCPRQDPATLFAAIPTAMPAVPVSPTQAVACCALPTQGAATAGSPTCAFGGDGCGGCAGCGNGSAPSTGSQDAASMSAAAWAPVATPVAPLGNRMSVPLMSAPAGQSSHSPLLTIPVSPSLSIRSAGGASQAPQQQEEGVKVVVKNTFIDVDSRCSSLHPARGARSCTARLSDCAADFGIPHDETGGESSVPDDMRAFRSISSSHSSSPSAAASHPWSPKTPAPLYPAPSLGAKEQSNEDPPPPQYPAAPEVLGAFVIKDGDVPSVGSRLHGMLDDSGVPACQPCAWFHKPSSCLNGEVCRYCHLCPQGELKNRKKSKVARMRGTEPIGDSKGEVSFHVAASPKVPSVQTAAHSAGRSAAAQQQQPQQQHPHQYHHHKSQGVSFRKGGKRRSGTADGSMSYFTPMAAAAR